MPLFTIIYIVIGSAVFATIITVFGNDVIKEYHSADARGKKMMLKGAGITLLIVVFGLIMVIPMLLLGKP